MDKIQQRFDELDEQAKVISASRHMRDGAIDYPTVLGQTNLGKPQVGDIDRQAHTKWQAGVVALLEKAFGHDSSIFQRFRRTVDAKSVTPNTDYAKRFDREYSLFEAAKEEYESDPISAQSEVSAPGEPSQSRRPLHDVVAEVIDRRNELSVGQATRVLWAMKVTSLIAIGSLFVLGFGLGYWFRELEGLPMPVEETGEVGDGPKYSLALVPPDVGVPELQDAEFDPRPYYEYATHRYLRRQEASEELPPVEVALRENAGKLEPDVGKRFEWQGHVHDMRVVYSEAAPNGRKIISVRIAPQDPTGQLTPASAKSIASGFHLVSCLFDVSKHLGRLQSIKEGDRIRVTGVLSSSNELVKCDFVEIEHKEKQQ